MQKYVERGRSPIFVTGDESHGLSPKRLIEACLEMDDLADYFVDGINKLSVINAGIFQRIMDLIPEGWMSPLAKPFTLTLLEETLNQLNSLKK